MQKIIKVTCALIVNTEGRIFLAQRSNAQSQPGKWEFLGGKIELSESPEECLLREIKEELDLVIQISEYMSASTHHYPNLSIELIPFICRIVAGVPKLMEHQTYEWVLPEHLLEYDLAAADIPIAENYLKNS